jgi:DNA processing protein
MFVNKLKVSDHNYPEILKNISGPPASIYWMGQEPGTWLGRHKIAVVGTRKYSAYGKYATEKLVTQLARAGVVIISGLAYGIDIIAHRAALDAGGTSVAVLPSSLDKIYPAPHYNIARQITLNGSLLSEYEPGSYIAYKSNFVARNRIISGLADGVLIPEASLKSGSLHTARFALEQGKTVMALPGNITSQASQGCNNLIKAGATPVTSVEDIYYALNICPPTQRQQTLFKGSRLETAVYSLIKDGVSDQEELIAAAKTDSSTLSSTLIMLEISGHIRPAGNGNWTPA